MRSIRHFLPVAAVLLFPEFASGQVPQSQTLQYVVTDLGTFAGGNDSRARGINDLGQVTGRAKRADGSYQAFIYPDASGGLKDIGLDVNTPTVGFSINNYGQVAVSDQNPGQGGHAYLYSGGLSNLGHLGGSCTCQSYGINLAGDVVGFASHQYCNPPSAFFYRNGMNDLGGSSSIGYAVNRAGWVVGINTAGGQAHIFRPSAIDLGTLGGSGSAGFGINGAAQVTGSAKLANGESHAFVYPDPATGTSMRDLGTVGGTASNGWAINHAGQVTGTFTTGGFTRAFLFAGGATYDLNNLIPDSADVMGIDESDLGNHINAWGQIAAEGIVASGDRHALLLTPRHMGMQFSGGLGDLPGGAFGSAALAVANGGVFAGGRGINTIGADAMTWTLIGEMVGADFNASGTLPDSQVNGVSADGSVAVGYHGATGRAFRLNTGSNSSIDMKNLTGHGFSTATAVAASGSFSTGWSGEANTSFQHAVRWDSAGNVFDELLPLTGGSKSVGLGISGDGGIVAGWSEFDGSGVKQAFRWAEADANEQVQGLGFLAGDTASVANAVSADGSVIVGRSSAGASGSAFRWTQSDATMHDLGDLPGGARDATALAVSGDGEVVVGTGTTAGGPAAFVWDRAHGIRSLQLVLGSDYNRAKKYGEYGLDFAGWTLTSANAISPDATTIGGEGIDPLGNTQAWIAQVNSRTYRFMNGETYTGFHTLRLGGFGSEAELLAGAVGGSPGGFRTVTITMQGTKGVTPVPSGGFFSDIANLSGTSNDTLVVQVSYDAALSGAPVLGWFNASEWVKAVEGNSAGQPAPTIGAFDGNLVLGRYGYDAANRVAWAVVNHGGQFAVMAGTQSSITTLAATNVANTSATLNASVSPDNKTVTVAFEYDDDAAFGSAFVAQVPGSFSGTDPIAVSAPLTSLTNNVTYSFRAKITVGAQVIYGAALTFTTQNRPPAAHDDTFIILGDAQLDALHNDTDADPGDTLTLLSVGNPTAASLGTAIVSADAGGGHISYSPGSFFDGEANGDAFSYTMKDAFGAEATATVRVFSVRVVAGTYSGLIGVDGGGLASGRLDAMLSRTGAITGSFKWQGQLYAFKDALLGSDGAVVKATPKIDGAGATLTLRLTLDPVARVLSGTLTDDSTLPPVVAAVEITGTATGDDLALNDLPEPGIFSAYIDPGTVSATEREDVAAGAPVLPRGLGFSQITIAGKSTRKSRPARVVGRMPDDQAFSSGARALIRALRAAAGNAKYPLYVDNLYPRVRGTNGRFGSGGGVSGDLAFQSSQSRFDSALNWERRPNPNALRFGGGIRGLTAALNAARYGRPAPGVLPGGVVNDTRTVNAKIELREGDLASVIVHPLKLTRAGTGPIRVRVEPQDSSANTQRVRLSINPNTGAFSGTFVHPANASLPKAPITSFHGVFKSQDARGGFIGPTNTGRVVILPQ